VSRLAPVTKKTKKQAVGLIVLTKAYRQRYLFIQQLDQSVIGHSSAGTDKAAPSRKFSSPLPPNFLCGQTGLSCRGISERAFDFGAPVEYWVSPGVHSIAVVESKDRPTRTTTEMGTVARPGYIYNGRPIPRYETVPLSSYEVPASHSTSEYQPITVEIRAGYRYYMLDDSDGPNWVTGKTTVADTLCLIETAKELTQPEIDSSHPCSSARVSVRAVSAPAPAPKH
jgi:hypothetical protein